MIYQLNYISKENIPFEESDIEALKKYAQAENLKNEVTSFLMYRNGYFIQILEGSLEVVESVFEKIQNDKRHTIVREKIIKRVEERSFANWSLEVKVAKTDSDVRYVREYDNHAYHLLSYFDTFKLV